MHAVPSELHLEARKRSGDLPRLAGVVLAGCLVALAALLVPAASEVEAKNRPNIVFIYTDEMRYDELWKIPRFRSLLVDRG